MKYFDIKNITKDRWESSVTLHLATEGSGFTYYSLTPGSILENVTEAQLSEQITTLSKQKRARPPVITITEIDYDARMEKKERELEVARERARKKLELLTAVKQDEVLEAPESKVLPAPDTKKKKRKSDLSDDEQKALEAGEELP